MSELEQQMSSDFTCSRATAQDRRHNSFRTALESSFRNRRLGPRRDCEAKDPHYVDVHKPLEFYIVIAALLLSVMDCFFTLTLLQHGSEELNPLMDYFIQRDAMLFFVVKFCITSSALLFLFLHKKFVVFNVLSGFQLLITSLLIYAVLVTYELSMLVHIL